MERMEPEVGTKGSQTSCIPWYIPVRFLFSVFLQEQLFFSLFLEYLWVINVEAHGVHCRMANAILIVLLTLQWSWVVRPAHSMVIKNIFTRILTTTATHISRRGGLCRILYSSLIFCGIAWVAYYSSSSCVSFVAFHTRWSGSPRHTSTGCRCFPTELTFWYATRPCRCMHKSMGWAQPRQRTVFRSLLSS